jgi:triphosphoribosyl-dephospho-CoA synthase
MDERGLRAALHEVLTGLDVRDAEETFAAIRLASPAGLGSSPEHDVHERATVTLLEAMTAARERDRVAAQYATDNQDVFGIGIPRLTSGLARCGDVHWAATFAYLGFLAAFPDSHVARKHGLARAERLRGAAAPVDAALHQAASASDLRSTLLSLDETLKQEGVNPGTSADLTVASLFARDLMRERA